jgi:hypothetical protein
MTDKKREELISALNSAGVVILRIEEKAVTDLCYDIEPDDVEHFDNKETPEIYVKNRVYIDLAPLPLLVDSVQH